MHAIAILKLKLGILVLGLLHVSFIFPCFVAVLIWLNTRIAISKNCEKNWKELKRTKTSNIVIMEKNRIRRKKENKRTGKVSHPFTSFK